MSSRSLFNLSAAALRLGFASQSVVALRMSKLAWGGPAASDEARRMVSEKATALVEAQLAAATAMMAGDPLLASRRALAVYRRRVKANQRRLAGPSP